MERLLPLLSGEDADVRRVVVAYLRNRRRHLSIDLLRPFFYVTNEKVWKAAAKILEVLDEQVPQICSETYSFILIVLCARWFFVLLKDKICRCYLTLLSMLALF